MVGLCSGFSCVNPRVESFSSDLPEMGWYNLGCLDCLETIKPIVVGFCSIGS